MNSIKEVFDHHCKTLDINRRWVKQLHEVEREFFTRNPDHIGFFGSGLIGVYPIKWLPRDTRNWFDNILDVDDVGLTDDISELASVDTSRKVSGSSLNQSFIYLIHRIFKSKLSRKEQDEAAAAVMKILYYKFISSLQTDYFKYPASNEVAQATFDAMTLRFELKREGSWGALIAKKAQHGTSKDGLHYQTFHRFAPDDKILYALSNIQTGIREVFKDITALFYRVKEGGNRILSTSLTMTFDNEISVTDVTRDHIRARRYLDSIVTDFNDFVRAEPLNAVMSAMGSVNRDIILQTLNYISVNYRDRKKSHIPAVIEKSMLYAFEFMNEKRIKENDLATLLVKLKAMYSGSRVRYREVIDIKDGMDKIISEALGKRKASYSAERTTIILYITIRALTERHYK